MARARLQNRERYANGRAKKPTKEESEITIKGVVVAYRQKHFGAPGEAANDERYGSVIGRLCIQKVVSETQYQAAKEYGRKREEELKRGNEQAPNPASPGFAMVSRGLACIPEPDEDYVNRKRKKHEDMMREIDELERFEGANGRHFRLVDLLDRVTIYDREIALTVPNLGSLRAALNVLARLWRMEGK